MLLDTQAALWWLVDDDRISDRAAAAIEGATALSLSVASIWELEIKRAKGKFNGPPLLELSSQAGFHLVEITAAHAVAAARLPAIHADPFDRMIVAQAMDLRTPIVTADALLAQYDARVIW